MKTLTIVLLLLSALVAGCAEGNYGEPPSPPATYSIAPAGGVAPSFYNYNPSLEQWYEPPYWCPYCD